MALTGQRIACRRDGWNQRFTLKIYFSCSLGGGGGGRYFFSSLHVGQLATNIRQIPDKNPGEAFFYLQLEFFGLPLSFFFACSPLRPFLEAHFPTVWQKKLQLQVKKLKL